MSRLGVPKQLIEFRSEPLVRRAARVAGEAGASPVIVVLGADAESIAHALVGSPVTHVPLPVAMKWPLSMPS